MNTDLKPFSSRGYKRRFDDEDEPREPAKKTFSRVLTKIGNVFGEDTLINARANIDKLSVCKFKNNGNLMRQVIFQKGIDEYNVSIPFYTFIFDSSGSIENLSEIDSTFLEDAKSVRALCKEGLLSLAARMNLKGEEADISFNILRYRLDGTQKEISGLPWHRDRIRHPRTGSYDLSMTVLISNYDQGENGFLGGDIFFKTDEELEECFSYEYNSGFIFENRSLQHKVSDIKAKFPDNLDDEHPVERMLFTIFFKHKSIDTNKFLLKCAKHLGDEVLF